MLRPSLLIHVLHFDYLKRILVPLRSVHRSSATI